MNKIYPVTPKGKKKLEDELNRLLHEERPRIVQDIERARDHGDLSENADYDAAKQQQGLNEARIAEIQNKLAHLEVIEPSQISSKTIVFGATVYLKDLEGQQDKLYKIVGEDEANIQEHTISVRSPLARALIGKAKGDFVEFMSPKGLKEYEVVKLEFK